MKLKAPSLVLQIFIGLLLGIVLGICWPGKDSWVVDLKLLSDIFMLLIKMVIAPLVLSVLIVGIAKVGDFKAVGRIGVKTLVYFTSATIIALLLGLVIVNVFEPGNKMDLKIPEETEKSGVEAKKFDAKSFISHVIPSSVAKAMSENEILPIVIFSIFFGMGVAALGNKGKIVVDFFEAVSNVMFKVTNYVMFFAPLGVLGAIAAVVAQQGAGVLSGYVYLILCFYGGLIFFAFGILWLVCLLFGIKFLKLFKAIRPAILLAFSTASSEAAMPKTMEALDEFGCPNKITSFVLPLGYSFNLDGSIMYMTFATLFIAQAYGIHMSAGDQITMMLIFLLTSKGVAGVPRASLVVIAGMLSTFSIPEAGLLLLLGIDQILDMGRSATNVVGNAVATAVVSRWEGEKLN